VLLDVDRVLFRVELNFYSARSAQRLDPPAKQT
jgi:hypothetical protein